MTTPLAKPKAPVKPRTPKGRLKRGSYLRRQLGLDEKAGLAAEAQERLAAVQAITTAASSPWKPITPDEPTPGTRVVISFPRETDGKRLYQIGVWGRMVVNNSNADLWMRVPDAAPQELA